MKITYESFCETGKRSDNQDYTRVVENPGTGEISFILCDGMGGHVMGGMASKIITTSIAKDLQKSSPKKTEDFVSILAKASDTLDTMGEIYGGAHMGTTLVLAHLDEDRLTVIHSGDSRCYVYSSDKNLRYRTEDHNEDGFLTRCFVSGYPEKAMPEVKTIQIQKGDRILLCSDGVYPSMAPDILRDRLMDEKPLADIIDTFKFMCEKFSHDNYSAILVKID